MTDKQIIMDGIDVSGCIYYEDGKCLNGEIVQCNCKKVAVCYYKEYKRKEQECKRLKHDNDYEVGALERTIDNLKAENDELKRENELAKQLINWILKFFELTDYDWQYDQNEISFLIEDCMDDKQSTIDFVTDINKELLTKLTEIKEIAEKRNYLDYNECLDDILQKISEVE